MAFIEFQLEVIGFINRADISEAFGVSTQQACADLKNHQEKSNTRLKYNLNRKRYEVAATENRERL